MKPGKILVAECSCRFLVFDVRGDPPARLLVARCRDYHDGSALAWALSEQADTLRAELWFLHGNGKGRELELLRSVGRGVEWSNSGFAPPPLSVRALVLPAKGLPLPA